MIWVLSEITLPLILAFLFGLGAGWLFWRWRRRSISQTEWDSHGKMSATDALKFSSLQEEVGVYQRRAEQLDATTQQHYTELSDAEKRTQNLNAELKAANDKLASLTSTGASVESFDAVQSLDFTQSSSDNEEKLQQALIREEQKATKITELEFRSNNLQNRVDEQDKLLLQANKDIKNLNAAVKTANDKLISNDPTVSAEDLIEVESRLSALKTEKAETEQQLKKAFSDVLVHKNTADELTTQTSALESTIKRQADELLVERKKSLQVTDELELLRSQSSQQNDSSHEVLRTLQSKLDLETTEKNDVIQKLKEATSDAQQKQTTKQQLQLAIEKLENTIQNQSSELQDADTKLGLMSDNLKAALERLEKQDRTSSEKLGELHSTLDTTTSEKNQLTNKLQEAASQADTQTALANELQQKLNQAETVATERDNAIAKLKQLEDELSTAINQNTEFQQTKTQLENVSQRFRNFQASAVANRQTREEQIEKLRARIEQLKTSLEQQREKASSSATDKQKIQQMESQLAHAKEATTELSQTKAIVIELNKQLNAKKSELAKSVEFNNKEDEILPQKNATLQQQRQKIETYSKDLRETKSKLAEITTQLNNARARNNQLTASAQPTVTPPAVTPISVAQINKLKKTVEEKEELITELERKLKPKKNRSATKKTDAKPNARKELSWQQGETKIGTPGCDHKDDLTAINGIGPKIEKVLNRLGIKSWEQLATLKSADIKRVDEQLADFSGRITRDEWVPQAKAIIRNGHQPVAKIANKVKKKPKKNKASKTAWQQGQTRFGTPGSIHKDDLQVINGIGPVIEKALNQRGIKSWEQLASLKAKEVKTIDEALDFPGRIKRENWVAQAKALMKQFPDHKDRPTRRTFLNQVAASR